LIKESLVSRLPGGMERRALKIILYKKQEIIGLRTKGGYKKG
jgi:hypothetical protein